MLRKYRFSPSYPTEQEEHDGSSEVDCPIFSLPWDRDVERQLNSIVAAQLPTEEELEDTGPEEPEERGPGPWWNVVNCSVEYFDRSWVSLVFYHFDYMGGAHEIPYARCLNIKIEKGRLVYLPHRYFFNEKINCSIKLRNLLTRKLFSQKIKNGTEDWEIDLNEDNLSLVSLTTKGLKFTFQPYVAGCYAEGYYFVTIPYLEIREILSFDIIDYFILNKSL